MTLWVLLEKIAKKRQISLEIAACIFDSVLNGRAVKYILEELALRVDERGLIADRKIDDRQTPPTGDVSDDVRVLLSFARSERCQSRGKKKKGAALEGITARTYAGKTTKSNNTFKFPKAAMQSPKDVNFFLCNRLAGKSLQTLRSKTSSISEVEDLAEITFPLKISSERSWISEVFKDCHKNDSYITLNEISGVFNKIGRLYADTSNFSGAKHYHLAALCLDIKNVSTLHQYARCQIEEGEFDNARATLETALQIDQEQHVTYMMLGEIEAKRGNLDLAVAMTKSAMFYKSELDLVHKALSSYIKKANHINISIKKIQKAMHLHDDDRPFVEYVVANTSEEEYEECNPDIKEFSPGGYAHWLIHGMEEGRVMPGIRTAVGTQITGGKWRKFYFRGRDVSVRVDERSGQPLQDCILRLKMGSPKSRLPPATAVDVIIPVYRGYEDTVRCIRSVFADRERPPGHVIVIDDRSPDTRLSRWLRRQQRDLGFVLLRNEHNLGFVASVNRGMLESKNDVVLLNSDTEVPIGWLCRLAEHAYSNKAVGTVTPLSNNATIFSYPAPGHSITARFSLEELNKAARAANRGLSVEVPTAMGFAMFIKRRCLDDVGLFDVDAFGKGYGEENDFCMRASKKGWLHVAACDTFVYHAGEVSFGPSSNLKNQASLTLDARHPEYNFLLNEWAARTPLLSAKLSLTVQLLKSTGLPVVLLVSHDLGGGIKRHIDDIVRESEGTAHFLLLTPAAHELRLHVPSIDAHPAVQISSDQRVDLLEFLKQLNISRIHIHHIMGFDRGLQDLITSLNSPIDYSVHDYYPLCPRVTFYDPYRQSYCGEPEQQACNECISRDFVNGATDIFSWRLEKRWVFQMSERVICPSEDVLRRLLRYGLSARTLVVPHPWLQRPTH